MDVFDNAKASLASSASTLASTINEHGAIALYRERFAGVGDVLALE